MWGGNPCGVRWWLPWPRVSPGVRMLIVGIRSVVCAVQEEGRELVLAAQQVWVLWLLV